MTKSQMIKFCNGRLKGLVTSETKIQMIYIAGTKDLFLSHYFKLRKQCS